MPINLILDIINFSIIVYLICKLVWNYKTYKNSLRNTRLAILIGTCVFLISELLLFTNTISNMFSIWERDYLFSHWEVRTMLRLGILTGLFVFGGIVNNSHFEFLTLNFWKNKFNKLWKQ